MSPKRGVVGLLGHEHFKDLYQAFTTFLVRFAATGFCIRLDAMKHSRPISFHGINRAQMIFGTVFKCAEPIIGPSMRVS